MKSREFSPAGYGEQAVTVPMEEILSLTPEVRAELDNKFEEIVESLDITVSDAEREQALKRPEEKVDGSYEPPYKKPK